MFLRTGPAFKWIARVPWDDCGLSLHQLKRSHKLWRILRRVAISAWLFQVSYPF